MKRKRLVIAGVSTLGILVLVMSGVLVILPYLRDRENRVVRQKVSASGGGIIASQDGSITLEIPPGSLVKDTVISVKVFPEDEWTEDIHRLEPVGAVYELEPDGLEFRKPIKIRLRLDAEGGSVVEDGQGSTFILLTKDSSGQWDLLNNLHTLINMSTGEVQVSGETVHFSNVSVRNGPLYAGITPAKNPGREWEALVFAGNATPSDELGVLEILPFATGVVKGPAKGLVSSIESQGEWGVYSIPYRCAQEGKGLFGAEITSYLSASYFDQFPPLERAAKFIAHLKDPFYVEVWGDAVCGGGEDDAETGEGEGDRGVPKTAPFFPDRKDENAAFSASITDYYPRSGDDPPIEQNVGEEVEIHWQIEAHGPMVIQNPVVGFHVIGPLLHVSTTYYDVPLGVSRGEGSLTLEGKLDLWSATLRGKFGLDSIPAPADQGPLPELYLPGLVNSSALEFTSTFTCDDVGEGIFYVVFLSVAPDGFSGGLREEPVMIEYRCIADEGASVPSDERSSQTSGPITEPPEDGVIDEDEETPPAEEDSQEKPAEDEPEEQPQPESAKISVEPGSIAFTHTIGSTSCSQHIGTVTISSSGDLIEWTISPDVGWLGFSTWEGETPEVVDVWFNCDINPVPQTLKGAFTVASIDQVVIIEVTGDIR